MERYREGCIRARIYDIVLPAMAVAQQKEGKKRWGEMTTADLFWSPFPRLNLIHSSIFWWLVSHSHSPTRQTWELAGLRCSHDCTVRRDEKIVGGLGQLGSVISDRIWMLISGPFFKKKKFTRGAHRAEW